MEKARLEAARIGKKTYRGKPCKVHGKTDRYVISGACRQCDIDKAAARYAATKAVLTKAREDYLNAPQSSQV
jgi:hypothetical protein